MRRAIQTAAPLARRLGLDPEIVADLREWDAEATVYIPWEEILAERGARYRAMVEARYRDLGLDLDFPAFRDRVVAAVESLVDAHPGRRVAVVGHGGAANAYLAHILRSPLANPFDPAYTSVTRVVASRDGERTIRSFGETGHLRGLVDTPSTVP
jgi:probable phosphoglycerate mutase